MELPAILVSAFLALFPPCPTEDSSFCGWNAATQGNGTGASFIALWGNAILTSDKES